jgi:cytochrome P450
MILLPTTLHGLDERAFPNPLEVDFNRPTPMHSTFGNGPHRCPGSNLGRTEIKVFLEEWLKRIPDLHFELYQVFVCVNSITIYYRAVLGKLATEVLYFNPDGKAYKALAHYNSE